MAMGPAPKKTRANARVATASGSSIPPWPVRPLCRCTFQMATERLMQIANAAGRVKEFRVKPGDQVQRNAVLAIIET